jgi:phosphoribosylamine---glycine ligase
MNILVVGSGGREHSLVWKIRKSPLVKNIYIAPGNGGTALLGQNIFISSDDIPGICALAREKHIDLVVVGPELPLVLGLADALQRENIPCFGPSSYAAQLEGSKAFSKFLMTDADVPTAEFKIFEDYNHALEYLKNQDYPLVIKADGLAAGKGVIVASNLDEAREAIHDMMIKQVFGKAGETVIIEEALNGEEASFLAFCDGHDFLLLPSSQDHKRIGDNDTGLNTGGMGAYSPAPVLPQEHYQETADLVIKPIIQHLEEMGRPFKGILYAGLMFTQDGPKVLEYNVRFGDPECQPLLMRMESDIVELMMACVEGRLQNSRIVIRPEAAVCVVLAANGYPRQYRKGQVITGIEDAEKDPLVKIFHAGTRLENKQLLTSGGRVLGVTSLGVDLKDAIDRCYVAADKVIFEDKYMRLDIGQKGLNR